MKKICLIRDERPYWSTIEKFLKSANAETKVLTREPESHEIGDCRPDLLIVNAKVHHDLGRRMKALPVVVVKEGSPPVALVREAADRNLLITGWPLEKSQFLEITSKMLSVPKRRSFHTILRIFTDGDDIGYLGQSTDFSLTGVAFKTDKGLEKGTQVTLSFSVPEVNRSIRVGAEVVRVAAGRAEGKTVYGARFTEMNAENRSALNAFIFSD